MQKFHMISGLPRSGSTLLSSILNQNPKFSAGIENPLKNVILASIRAFSNDEYLTKFNERKKINVLRGIIKSYYDDEDCEVAFNSSRLWTSNLSLMNILHPDAKVICCVRDIMWILDSLEKLYNQNPTVFSNFFYGPLERNLNTDVIMRSENFMQDGSFLIEAFQSLKTAYYSDYSNKLIFIEYDDLVKDPKNTVQKIYNFIEQPWFNHDFNNVECSYDEYDFLIGVRNLHKVRKKIESQKRNTVIPPEIWQKYSGLEFWRN